MTRGCTHRKLDVVLPEDHPLIRAVHGGPLNVSADLLAESGRREREYREAMARAAGDRQLLLWPEAA